MNPDALHDLTGCFEQDVPDGTRRIAWNGISFCVPANWELTTFRFLRHGVSRIELEDEYSVRLESEWIRGKKQLKLARIMKRYEEASKPLTLRTDERTELTGLPEGWHATHFVLKETDSDKKNPDLHITRNDLVTAFYLCPQSRLFCFFLLHFVPEDKETPVDIIRGLAAAFQDHGEAEATPWQLFDIGFKLPRELKLSRATFDIGSKLMLFRWKRRRFYLWHFSCADVFLKDGQTPAHWSAGYLNSFSGIRGPVFYPDDEGNIAWRRRRPYIFGHRDEIAHMCHRYKTGWHMMEAENCLVVWVFNYRREDDLRMLQSVLGSL